MGDGAFDSPDLPRDRPGGGAEGGLTPSENRSRQATAASGGGSGRTMIRSDPLYSAATERETTIMADRLTR